MAGLFVSTAGSDTAGDGSQSKPWVDRATGTSRGVDVIHNTLCYYVRPADRGAIERHAAE